MEATNNRNVNTIEYWDGRYAKEGGHVWNILDMADQISAHIPQKHTVLDVAVGGAMVTKALHALRPDLTFYGCDFSEQAIYLLRGTFFQDLWFYDLRKPVEDKYRKYADTVIATEAIEHMEDPVQAVAHLVEMARVQVIITVPNQRTIPSFEHLWFFDYEDIQRLLAPHGGTFIKPVRNGRNIMGTVILCK